MVKYEDFKDNYFSSKIKDLYFFKDSNKPFEDVKTLSLYINKVKVFLEVV